MLPAPRVPITSPSAASRVRPSQHLQMMLHTPPRPSPFGAYRPRAAPLPLCLQSAPAGGVDVHHLNVSASPSGGNSSITPACRGYRLMVERRGTASVAALPAQPSDVGPLSSLVFCHKIHHGHAFIVPFILKRLSNSTKRLQPPRLSSR